MLEIKDLYVEVDGKPILQGINLTIKAGEVHAIMGPNGSGKSTLSYILSGKEGYEVKSGEIIYKGIDILGLSPDERARDGVFLVFQYPVEIPGVPMLTFLRSALNSKRKGNGEKEITAPDFLKLVREKSAKLNVSMDMLKRSVNLGYSGGEKKRVEILQMAILEPDLCILDEMDSGLDIDALKIAAQGVNDLRNNNRAVIAITHYQRLLNYIVPDQVHVLSNGKIVCSGSKDLALELEANGYAQYDEAV